LTGVSAYRQSVIFSHLPVRSIRIIEVTVGV
jgi:hypothetical protein